MAEHKYVSIPKFAEYRERFKEHFILERKNGIILAACIPMAEMLSGAMLSTMLYRNSGRTIGNDPENEVMILTSTGKYWIGEWDPEDMGQSQGEGNYGLHYDAVKLQENLINDIDIPTIAAVNGPGWHTEFGTLCDITICTPDAMFQDGHFSGGAVPGDGQFLTFQGVLGAKRAAYYMFTGKNIDAKTALELGYVSEIVPRKTLLDRAWELAEIIMKQPRIVRRMTSQLVRRPWKRLFMEDFPVHMPHQWYAAEVVKASGVPRDRRGFDRIKESWKKAK